MKNVMNVSALLVMLCIGNTRAMEIEEDKSALNDALMLLCCTDSPDLALVQGVLKAGADANVQCEGAELCNKFGLKGELVINLGSMLDGQIFTPLSLAALRDNDRLVKLLINYHANINLDVYKRQTQNWLPGLYSEFQTCQDLTALFWACYHENVKEVGFMLEKIKTADLNGRSIKAQLIPLFINHNAFSLPSHSLAMFTLLKKHGFDFNQEIVPQGTPLMFAIRYNQLALVDYLVTVCGVNLNDCLQPVSYTHLSHSFQRRLQSLRRNEN